MAFNEDSRVKIPALLYLVRLGYPYPHFSLRRAVLPTILVCFQRDRTLGNSFHSAPRTAKVGPPTANPN